MKELREETDEDNMGKKKKIKKFSKKRATKQTRKDTACAADASLQTNRENIATGYGVVDTEARCIHNDIDNNKDPDL